MEISLTTLFKEGIGIDSSLNGISYANEVAKLSEMNNIKFIQGDENTILNYPNYFDFVITVNTLDVLPNEIVTKIIENLSKTLRDDGHLIVCLNPDFTREELTSLIKMTKDENMDYYYRDNIFRCNYKSINEWCDLLGKYFIVVEIKEFSLNEGPYKRRMIILKKAYQ